MGCEMKKTKACKAEPLRQKIESQTIIINGKIPEDLWIDNKSEEFYDNEAQMIDNALWSSLPQATYDRLGIMFMKRKLFIYQGRTGT